MSSRTDSNSSQDSSPPSTVSSPPPSYPHSSSSNASVPCMSGFSFAVIQDYIISNHGIENWNQIVDVVRKSCPEASAGFFFSTQMYHIPTLQTMVGTASAILGIPIETLLEEGGYWFVFYVRDHHAYKTLLDNLGKSLPEALRNLNRIHKLVRVTFPLPVETPSVWISKETPNSLIVNYIPGAPERKGLLRGVVKGAIKSMAEVLFKLEGVSIVHLAFDEKTGKETYFITWKQEEDTKTNAGTPTSCTPKLGLSANAFANTFPFHVAFNIPSQEIVHLGPRFHDLIESVDISSKMSQHFTIATPAKTTFDDLMSHYDSELYTVSVAWEEDTISFSGQILIDDFGSTVEGQKLAIFLCWPLCQDAQQASYYGLSPQDYPLHAAFVNPFLSSLHNDNSKFDYQRLLSELEETKRVGSSSGTKSSGKDKDEKKDSSEGKKSFKNIIGIPFRRSESVKSPKENKESSDPKEPLSPTGGNSQKQLQNLVEDSFIKNLKSGEFQNKGFEEVSSIERSMIYKQLRFGSVVLRERALKWIINAMKKNITTRSSSKPEEKELGAFRQKTLISEIMESNCFLVLHEAVIEAQIQDIHSQISWTQITLAQKIASGAAASVHSAIYKGHPVAVKILKSKTKEDLEELRAEAFFMSALDHPNLMHCIGASLNLDDHGPYLVLPLMKCTLWDYIHKSEITKHRPHRLLIALGIAKSLQYLHSFPILHRDLKSPNVLLDEHFHPKLSDLGLARIESSRLMTKCVGTPLWMAPEVLTGDYGAPADVYSFSIILWELMTLEEPYKKMRSHEIITYVKKGGRPDIPKNIPAEDQPFYKIIQQSWHKQAHKRMTMTQIVDELQRLCNI